MSDPLIRECDHYVVLEPGAAAERILSAADTLTWLQQQLAAVESLPADLSALVDDRARAERLLETACELELSPGEPIQWFAVRLEPSDAAAAGRNG